MACLGAAAILASCSPSAGAKQVPSGPSGQCPSGVPSTIDRLDFIILSGIQYQSEKARIGRRITEQDVGAPYGRVRCMLADLKFDPSYNEMQDGNAGFLPSGTVVYRVNGYAPYFRLAARRDGQIILYESDFNPTARRGSDLLDLVGKVSTILSRGILTPREFRTAIEGAAAHPA